MPCSVGKILGLELILSESAAMLHMVDCLSQWHPYAGHPGAPEAKLLGWQLNLSDQTDLANYAEARLALGWEREMDLFAWAVEGFPNHPEFDALRLPLEGLLSRNGRKEDLSRRQEQVAAIVPRLSATQASVEPKVARLNEFSAFLWRGAAKELGAIPAYLFFALAPNQSKGGANGEGVYAEVWHESSEDQLKGTLGTLLHEMLHLSCRPAKALEAHLRETGREGLLRELQKNVDGTNPEIQIFEEMVVYSLSPGWLLEADARSRVEHFILKKQHHYARIWSGVERIQPLVLDALEKRITREAFLEGALSRFLALAQPS